MLITLLGSKTSCAAFALNLLGASEGGQPSDYRATKAPHTASYTNRTKQGPSKHSKGDDARPP